MHKLLARYRILLWNRWIARRLESWKKISTFEGVMHQDIYWKDTNLLLSQSLILGCDNPPDLLVSYDISCWYVGVISNGYPLFDILSFRNILSPLNCGRKTMGGELCEVLDPVSSVFFCSSLTILFEFRKAQGWGRWKSPTRRFCLWRLLPTAPIRISPIDEDWKILQQIPTKNESWKSTLSIIKIWLDTDPDR